LTRSRLAAEKAHADFRRARIIDDTNRAVAIVLFSRR